MICYRDMTFCRHYEGCRDGLACHRALTPAVEAGARAWWGHKDGAPIATYIEQPNCFVAKEKPCAISPSATAGKRGSPNGSISPSPSPAS